jgi:hypothetical protein
MTPPTPADGGPRLPRPLALAEFYRSLIGGDVSYDGNDLAAALIQ